MRLGGREHIPALKRTLNASSNYTTFPSFCQLPLPHSAYYYILYHFALLLSILSGKKRKKTRFGTILRQILSRGRGHQKELTNVPESGRISMSPGTGRGAAQFHKAVGEYPPKGGESMPVTITFHWCGLTITVRIKRDNRHPGR